MNVNVKVPVRLNRENLFQVPSEFVLPRYNPQDVEASILHVGPSAFFRGHIAKYAHERLNDAHDNGQPLKWGIRAVSLRSTDVRDALAPQDYLYSLTTKSAAGTQQEIIGSIKDILCAREDINAVLEAAADPNIKLITLTVTQNGYYLTKDNQVDLDHKDLKACLDQNSNELSSLGFIAHALQMRRDRGIAPPVVMSCDNMDGNGSKLRTAVMSYANQLEPGLGDWIGTHVPFPNTMVDRITPSRNEVHVKSVLMQGLIDEWPVEAEPLPRTPLVIQTMQTDEKSALLKASGLFELEKYGVIFTPEVSAYENMKVRTLNGVHMGMGAVGHLAGYGFTHEAMEDPYVRAFAVGFMNEVGQTLSPIDGFDMDEFRRNVVERLDNVQICDPLTRLVRKGVSKLQTRFLNSMRDCVANDKPYQHLAFAMASWMHYTATLDEEGYLPSQKASVNFARASGKNPEEPNDAESAKYGFPSQIRDNALISGVFSNATVFGQDFSQRSDVIRDIQGHFDNIRQNGMKNALAMFLQEVGSEPIYKTAVTVRQSSSRGLTLQ